jgi:TRAP-type C4-dicarboxylate transport system substrate-binding protein
MMVNKRPITTPEDMRGLTMRVQESPAYVAFMKALGANPVPMPYVEVYLAMKQGTIDGMELPSFTLTSDKFQEVTKYYSLTRHSYPPIAYFMSLKRYQSLSPDLQKVVGEAMQHTCALHRKLEVEREKQDYEVMKKAGTQINEVKDLKAFQALMKPVYASVEQQVG